MKKSYQGSENEVLKAFGSRVTGLSDKEVIEIREKAGKNELIEEKKKSVWEVFLLQFCDLLVVILIIAAFISLISGNTESTIVIFAVLLLNAILGTVQHVKAQKSLDSLKALAAPTCRVVREGKQQMILVSDVVPGDILHLEAGDIVAADGRILENHSLQVNESSLTGESMNIEKKVCEISKEVPLGDRVNMVFSGSLVTYGRAMVVITATGMNTEIGKIAGLMNATKEKKTPLQVSLDKFSKTLSIGILIICAIVFGLSLYRGMEVLDSLMFAVALAVAAIPEALSSIITIVQAMGTQKMARENAIMKELRAVESLGCVSVICSDKTGTLTQNKMTVQRLYYDGKLSLGKIPCLKGKLLYHMVLNNDADYQNEKGIGDPTEICLLELVEKTGENINDIRRNNPRLAELPFDSDRKLMSSMYQLSGKQILFTKGAFDVLLGRCDRIEEKGIVRAITDKDRENFAYYNEEFSANGLRVLTFAYKEMPPEKEVSLEEENHLILQGIVGMMDPPRTESAEAVARAKEAGIKTVMITGDHKVTATAIAKEIGIYREGDLAITGMELENMSDEELEEKLPQISVYARVSPKHKIRIVEGFQKRGCIVAMTGDGVNDAPALKKADIGVAMGITGTEVSKDAAAMILADDNFATIIKAVANGRGVYRNIKNAVGYLLSGNMAGILAVLYASFAALPMPFTPVHLLFMNLVTDSLPALAIGMEPAGEELLKEPPRNPREGILERRFVKTFVLQGLLIAVFTLLCYYESLNTTMAFAALTMARLFHGFNLRSTESLFRIGFRSNVWSIKAFVTGMVLIHLVLFVPFLQRIFECEVLSMIQMCYVYACALAPTLLIQLGRMTSLFKTRLQPYDNQR